MPPKKDPRNTALEMALPKLKANIKRKTGKNANNSILQTSISTFRTMPSVNLGKASKVLSQLYNTEYSKRQADEEAALAELERTGGIDLRAEMDKYKKEWIDSGDYIETKFHPRGGYNRELNPIQKELVQAINDVLGDESYGFKPDFRLPAFSSQEMYAVKSIVRDIIIGKYDDKIDKLMLAIKEQSGKTIPIRPGGIDFEYAATGRPKVGGGRRRRRTYKNRRTRKH